MALPKILFVKHEKDGDSDYFVADENPASLVGTGDKFRIGIYTLTSVEEIEGTVTRRPVAARSSKEKN